MRRALLLSVGLAACSPQTTVSVTDQAPVVTIISPLGGQSFEPGVWFPLCAQVNDDDPMSTETLTLSASVDGDLNGATTGWTDTCAGGNLATNVTLTGDAEQILGLVVADPRGKSSQAQVTLEPTFDSPPSCEILSPSPGTSFDQSVSIDFQASASDAETDAAGLTAELSSDLDNTFWTGVPDSTGAIDAPIATLSPGDQHVTLSVTDPRGKVGTCTVEITVNACTDLDHDGYTTCGGDCDDTRADVNPGAAEVVNGIDDNCDGRIDEGTVLSDDDGDGYSEIDGDCNDADPNTYPGAPEIWYDGVDEACDGGSDYDQDGDGYDIVGSPSGGSDCDDTDATVHPLAVETYYDGVDQNCDGHSDYDADWDGFDSSAYGGDDCDDTSAAIFPGAPEVWYDGVDENCDELSDYDADGDGFDSSTYGGTDCDDGDASVYVGATEVRDGVDNNCDGACDEGLLSAGDLLVTEIMYDPAAVGDTYGEWFEVYNTTAIDIRICADWSFTDKGTDAFSMATGAQLLVPAGGYAVLGRSTDTTKTDTAYNGGAAVDYGYGTSGFALGNSGDEVILSFGGTAITEVDYGTSSGSGWPHKTGGGYSIELGTSHLDAADENTPASWCLASSVYGAGDDGTPGASNDCP